MNIIELQGVSKSYPIYDSPSLRLKELFTLNRASYHKDFWALQDISLEIKKGETFCVVGENGSGKKHAATDGGWNFAANEGHN